MDILIQEYLENKVKLDALKAENAKEQYTTRYFANLVRIEELEVAVSWALSQIEWGDKRSYLI